MLLGERSGPQRLPDQPASSVALRVSTVQSHLETEREHPRKTRGLLVLQIMGAAWPGGSQLEIGMGLAY